MQRTISAMVGDGSVNHNSRKFKAANVDGERTHLDVDYCNENIKKVYHKLFDEALKKYNDKQTRSDRKIKNYYDKICNSKQEKPFHEIILQIGNKEDMGAESENGQLAKQVLDEYFRGFQERNPQLRVFSAHLHMDEATPHDGYVTLVNAKEENGVLTETAERTGIWAWKHPHHDGTLTYTKLEGRVVLDSVDFGYVPEKQVLYDVSVYAEPGQKIAFVGATGAGKTTITNLINRFYDIADGKIRYDGININKIKKADLRRSLGVVLQEVNLFTGTVMENLRYGNLDATDENCIAAAKLANADGFIRMLPQGYNTVLKGDGSGLSQGQRQLISIARAAVSDPPVMVLDEATSSIDTRTEALVQDGMDKLMKGRTVFVIAHRLSTVQNSDVIMVLDHGHIIERGNHEKLIAEKGTYYQLYTGAFELE